MKNQLLKNVCIVTLLLLATSLTSCKKQIEEVKIPSYDEINRIFRVKVSSVDKSPYKLLIKRSKKDVIIDITAIDQQTGTAFEYAFTPAIGETITVTVNSTAKERIAYCHYAGLHTWAINLQGSTGAYSGTLEYSVVD